jgi:hypothetical protein
LAVACSDDSTGPAAEGGSAAGYLATLPTWNEFAAPDTILSDELDVGGDTLAIQETTLDSVPVFGPSGIDSTLTNVRYVCQARPHTISDAPERVVMFAPNRANLYAGAFIQGKSRKELGALLPLRIAERNQIMVSIPELATASNSREVVPTQAAVDGAWGSMIGSAVTDDLQTGVITSFEMSTYHSERSFAIAANLSGRYLGFEANASGSLDQSIAETTVTAHFVERMYTMVVEPPLNGFFSDAFNQAALDGYIGSGLIGPDNLPVYISEVVYGRMMMFSVTSTATEQEIRTAMQASYNTFAGSASGGLNSKDEAILNKSKITITAVGGSGDAVATMIRTGDWSTYFETSPLLSEAVPLSYTFTNIGDGSIAAVTESTNYNINECQPKPLIPGTFDFNAKQTFAVPLTAGYQTLFGDVNDDGREDMVFSYASGSTNEIAVALADALGGYSVQAAQDATVKPAEGWSLFNKAAWPRSAMSAG